MLQCKRQNIHWSKLPKPGEIGHIVGLRTVDSRRKCIVSHYSITGNSSVSAASGSGRLCDDLPATCTMLHFFTTGIQISAWKSGAS
jgi:N-acetylglutamate synthase/N-acetylornithine aminotransferase